MASLNIRNVEPSLLWEVRVRAASERMTVKDWTLALIEREVNGQTQAETDRQKQSSLASPKRRASKQKHPTARKQGQGEIAAHLEPITPAEPHKASEGAEPCRHGLTFHPGCNA